MIRSKDIMTSKVITVRAGQTMTIAHALMNAKNIRHLPVVDDKNSVIGMLSDRDVTLAMTVQKLNSLQQTITLDQDFLVEDFMSWPVYVVSEETSLKKVAEEMLAQKISAFLVQDMEGQMKGIVTTDDLIKLFVADSPVRPESTLKSFTKYLFNPEVN